MSDHSIADRIKMSVDKKGQEMFSEEDDKIDFAGADTSTPKMGDRESKSVKIEENAPIPDPLSNQVEFEKGDELNGIKFKTNTKIPPLSKQFESGDELNGVKFKVSTKIPSQGERKKGCSTYERDEGSITHVYEVNQAQFLRIPQFSGDDPPQKGDVSYKEWRYEVQCLRNDPEVKESSIIQSVRRSLRGTAKQMLIPLGEKARLREILEKLDILFGEVSDNGMIMQEFFGAYQLPSECATSFGCRLETMLQNAIDNGYLDKASKNDLLRHKFWTSLRSEKLKGQTRHKYDSITKYDKLLLEIRRVEKELSISTRADEKKGVVHQHGMSTESDLQVLEQKMNKKMEDMEKTLNGKLDEKFNQILAKLDTRKETGSNNNYHGGWSRGNNGRGRGNYRGNVSQVRGHSYDSRYQGRRQNRGGYYSNNSGKPPNM